MAQRKDGCSRRKLYTELGNSLHTQQNAPAQCWKPFTLKWSSRSRSHKMMFYKLFFTKTVFILLQPFTIRTKSYRLFFILLSHFSRLFVNLALRNTIFLLSFFPPFSNCTTHSVAEITFRYISFFSVKSNASTLKTLCVLFVYLRACTNYDNAIFSRSALTFPVDCRVIPFNTFSVVFEFSLILMEFLFCKYFSL